MNIQFTEEGIIIIHPPKDFKGPETVEHAKENVELIKSKFGDRVNGILAFLPDHYVNVEATRFYKINGPNVPAALIGSSFFKNMIGKFLLSMKSEDKPMKIFSDREPAYQWLLSQIKMAS